MSFHHAVILPAALDPGYPAETLDMATHVTLCLWLDEVGT